jgi:hypothetical protein
VDFPLWAENPIGLSTFFVDAEDAFADLSHTLHTRQHSQSV